MCAEDSVAAGAGADVLWAAVTWTKAIRHAAARGPVVNRVPNGSQLQ